MLAAIAPIVVCAVALLACGKCPEPPFTTLGSGSYRATTSGGSRDPRFPHFDATGKTMTIDRATGTVVMRFERGGRKVVERWKIKGVTTEEH